MGREAAGEREEEGDEDQRKREDGEDDVGGEELPVERPPGAEAVEVGFAVEGEVDEVGDEEDRGEEEGCEHRGAVQRDAAGADEAVAEEQRDGRERVEDGVDAAGASGVGCRRRRWGRGSRRASR